MSQCNSPKKDDSTQVDSVKANSQAVSDSSRATDKISTPSDSTIVLSEFVQDPFSADVSYIKDVLRRKGVSVKDSTSNGISHLSFEKSHIDLLINEIYGNMLCSAEIVSNNFPMNQGIVIGMTKENFMRLAKVDESRFLPDINRGLSSFEYTVGNDHYWRAIFWFDSTRLQKVKYEIYPCVITG